MKPLHQTGTAYYFTRICNRHGLKRVDQHGRQPVEVDCINSLYDSWIEVEIKLYPPLRRSILAVPCIYYSSQMLQTFWTQRRGISRLMVKQRDKKRKACRQAADSYTCDAPKSSRQPIYHVAGELQQIWSVDPNKKPISWNEMAEDELNQGIN
jgi:hypothetical protein